MTKQIKWLNEKHGDYNRGPISGLLNPYLSASLSNYVCSCMDCHEPHGSRLPYLLREEVNNHVVNITNYSQAWPISMQDNFYEFCISCHTYPKSTNVPVIHHAVFDGETTTWGAAQLLDHEYSGGYPIAANAVWRNCSTSPLGSGGGFACHGHRDGDGSATAF
jgi:hypothetical protein